MQNPASSGGCLPSSAAPVISSALEGVPAQAVASWLQAPWEPRTADFADNTVGTRPGAGAGTTVLSLAELPLLGWWASGQRGCCPGSEPHLQVCPTDQSRRTELGPRIVVWILRAGHSRLWFRASSHCPS